MLTVFWSEFLNVRDHLKDLGVDGSIILDWILDGCGGKMWTGCI
jgi:hypothetical protein